MKLNATVEHDGRLDGPIHSWFQLSYSNYLILPRAILQAMPIEWQRRFTVCLDEARAACYDLHVNDRYTVLLRNDTGRFVDDPYANYRHPIITRLDPPARDPDAEAAEVLEFRRFAEP